MPLARRLARNALAEGLAHPAFLNLRALDHEEAGRFEDALRDVMRAHELAPNDLATLNACGVCLARLERDGEAVGWFDRALAIDPRFAPGWFGRGWALERLGDVSEATRSYAQAVAIDPSQALAWANLAFLAVRRGDHESARDHADRALALSPGLVMARLARAEADADHPVDAERRLRTLLADPAIAGAERALALGLLADSLDAQDRVDEAFAAYGDCNDAFRAPATPRFEPPDLDALPDTLARLNRWAEGLDGPRWVAGAAGELPDTGEAGHVFLLGFARSGTTLIETALGRHPDVVSLEERDTLYAAIVDFLNPADGLTRLEELGQADLRRYRDDYWARVRGFGVEPAGRVFIDKNPSNTLKLPLIQKLFPRAKVIFAVRDPRDVVLSCFRRRFKLNPTTYEFLDLARTAAHYDQSMRLAQTLRARQTLREHRLVHERLIEDFPTVAREVCAFIGVDWRDTLVDVADRARRGEIASASSAQIARGLNADGVGQWRRYRAHLAPVLPILAPWVRAFGYAED